MANKTLTSVSYDLFIYFDIMINYLKKKRISILFRTKKKLFF